MLILAAELSGAQAITILCLFLAIVIGMLLNIILVITMRRLNKRIVKSTDEKLLSAKIAEEEEAETSICVSDEAE